MRRPVINLGESPYHNNYDLEAELKEERKESKKYCEFCSILMVYNAKAETFICPACGFNPTYIENREEEDNHNITTPSSPTILNSQPLTTDEGRDEVEGEQYIETARHFRSAKPGAKSKSPIPDEDADEAMRFRPVSSETSRVAQSRNRFAVDDPDLARLQSMGATIIKYDEQSSSKGTLSKEDIDKEREHRLNKG